MKKMAQMYAAEEVIKHALPKVTQQFKNFTGSGQSRRYEEPPPPYSYQTQPTYQQNYYQPGASNYQQPGASNYQQPGASNYQQPGASNYQQPGASNYYHDQPSSSHQQYQNGSQSSNLAGTLSTIGKVAGKVAVETGKAAVIAGKKVKNMIDAESLKGMLKDGNIVQLVSLSSGRTVQILQNNNGQLILDGQGGIGNQYFNSHFHVSKDPIDHGLRLHNQYNFLAIINGAVTLIHQEPGQKPHPGTKFKVKCESGNSIQFESVHERRRFIEVASNGQIKSAAFSSQDSPDAQFSVNVIFKVSY